MIDFTASLSFGMSIAQKRYENFLEIHKVFTELKNQIEQYFNNKVKIELVSFNGTGDYFEVYPNTQDILYEDKKLYACLASDPDNIFSLLTKLNLSKDGYPCTIEINGDKYDSFDKRSLEENLQSLLSTASVGDGIFKIIQTANTDID